ncbi:MAG TPA: metallophosphoesterase [Pirellulales bacterium]|jgi:hypothetical protein|nr:metallophosphoesterase [Pirellulales bacterium]
MLVVTFALVLLALLGHAALWIGFVNRAHAVGFSRGVTKLFSAIGYALLVLPPVAACWAWAKSGEAWEQLPSWVKGEPGLAIYLLLCWAVALIIIGLWIRRYWLTAKLPAVRSWQVTVVDVAAKLGHKPLHGWRPRLLSFVPGNQLLQLAVEQREFVLERLPAALDGLSITHLSDLHFTGHVGREFFQEVIAQANALRSDLIAITGDILDDIRLVDWIPKILSDLAAPLGTYFVLGNHDEFTRDAPKVRQALVAAGLVDVGNQWRHLEAAGVEIILAGNEVPWFRPAPDLRQCPSRTSEHPQLRLLLAHTPDQLGWARRYEFDLMLAGHVHGGQVRFPLVGPVLAPSWHGVKYASGTFYAASTLMHVSRGISSELPLRINCRPELTKIVLRAMNG